MKKGGERVEALKGVEKEEKEKGKGRGEKMRFAIVGERNETPVHHFKRA